MTRTLQASLSGIAWLMLISLAALWGGSFFWAEIALNELPPLTIVLFRVGLAIPVLALVVWIKGLIIPRTIRILGAYLVMGALNNAIPFSLIVWGQTRIEGGLASILNATTAVFGAVVAGLLLADERLTPLKLLGAGLGLAGVAAIMGRQALFGLDPRDVAQLAILGAALSYSLASVWGKIALRGVAPEVNALGMVVGGTVWMIPIVLVTEGVPTFDYSPAVWGSLFGLAWLATAVAYLLYFGILNRAGAANLMLVTLLIPPFAVGLGWVFLSERLEPSAWVGFSLIAAGLVVTDGRMLKAMRPGR